MKIDKKKPSYLDRSNKGGLLVGFIYVLAFMSILFLWIWQTFESENNNSSMKIIDERLSVIEEQINIADESNNDTVNDLSSSIQFLDKEIRKLWDLSNKRNKVNIQKLTQQTLEIEDILNNLDKSVSQNKKSLVAIRNSLEKEIENIRSSSASNNDLEMIKLNLNSIDTQLMLLDDSVQALNGYKNQLNQTILEIQTQVSSYQMSSESNLQEN
tara:strand:+ start:1059 stop:1697 length:639 start_codon:yes stop_codon:yes gene_type:complete